MAPVLMKLRRFLNNMFIFAASAGRVYLLPLSNCIPLLRSYNEPKSFFNHGELIVKMVERVERSTFLLYFKIA